MRGGFQSNEVCLFLMKSYRRSNSLRFARKVVELFCIVICYRLDLLPRSFASGSLTAVAKESSSEDDDRCCWVNEISLRPNYCVLLSSGDRRYSCTTNPLFCPEFQLLEYMGYLNPYCGIFIAVVFVVVLL